MKHFFVILISAFTTFFSVAQIQMPEASPAASISQAIGFSKISVEYNRPQLSGRDMFADLTRIGEVWRTGANMATRLTIEEEGVMIEGKALPIGKYSIYSIPGKSEWTVIINNKIQWGTVYSEADDFLRIKVPIGKAPRASESFTFYFREVTEDKGILGFSWDKTQVEMIIASPTHEKVLSQIKEMMKDEAGAEDGDLYGAADYYLKKNLDVKKALVWANMFVDRQPDKYWGYRLKARALAANGQYADAITFANQSTDLATEAGNMDYVHNNGKSIAEWKKKK